MSPSSKRTVSACSAASVRAERMASAERSRPVTRCPRAARRERVSAQTAGEVEESGRVTRASASVRNATSWPVSSGGTAARQKSSAREPKNDSYQADDMGKLRGKGKARSRGVQAEDLASHCGRVRTPAIRRARSGRHFEETPLRRRMPSGVHAWTGRGNPRCGPVEESRPVELTGPYARDARREQVAGRRSGDGDRRVRRQQLRRTS